MASLTMLREPDDFRDAIHDLLAAEYYCGVQWADLGLISPVYGGRFGSFDDVIDLIARTIERARLQPSGVGLMLTVLRNQRVELA